MKNRIKQSTLFKFLNLFSKVKLLGLLLGFISFNLLGQQGMQVAPGVEIACPMGTADAHSLHGMDFDREALLQKQPTAEFEITFGNGFEDNEEARAAFEFATEIWAREIVSSVPIRIEVQFDVFFSSVIASASATYTVSDFPGAPVPSLLYNGALANAITGEVLQPNAVSEISITYGEQVDFYFGIDGNTPSQQIDFVSTSLHEIAHGLGFSGSANVVNNLGSFTEFSEAPLVYTNFIANNNNLKALELRNSGIELGVFFRSEEVSFSGKNATSANLGVAPPLYAPSTFNVGSSISHWDEDTYPAGNPNSLMTPIQNMSESNFNVGDITRGLLKDIGWELNNSKLFPIILGEVEGDFEVEIGGEANQTFIVKNVANKTLTYNVSLQNNNEGLSFLVTNGEDITLQPNEEKTVTISLNTEAVNSGTFNLGVTIATSLSEFEKQKTLSFGVLDGSETAIINTIETLEQNFAIVNEFDDSFRINNQGDKILDYSIAIENQETPILSINETEGSIVPNDFTVVKYNLNRENVVAGTYTAEVVITSNAQNTPVLRIPVTIIVRDTLNPPSFGITISREINVEIEVGSTTDIDQAQITFEIENSGEVPLEFSLQEQETDLIRTTITDSNNNVIQPGATVTRVITIIPGIDTIGTNFSSEIVFTSNDPSLTELRIPLNITLSRERGRLVSVPNLDITSNIVEQGTSVTNVIQFVNTGLAPILVSDVQPISLGLSILDWSSASGDATIEVGETLTVRTRLANTQNSSLNFFTNSIRIISDSTPSSGFDNAYDSAVQIVEPSGLLVSEYLLSEIVNINSVRDTENPIKIQNVELTNIEDAPIEYSISIVGDESSVFSVNSNGGTLAANESVTLTITSNISNLNEGEFTGEIIISEKESSAVDAIINTRLSVVNQQGFLVFNPFSTFVDFFDNFIAGAAEFTNESRTVVEVTNISVDGNVPFQELFAFSDSGEEFPSELLVVQPGESVIIDYFYIPTSTDQGNIIISSNASNSEFLIPVEIEFPEDLEPQVLGYQLIDTVTNAVVETFFDGATVDLATYENPVSLVAFTGAAQPGSVVFDYTDSANFRIDNEAPFSLGSSFKERLFPFNFTLGEQTITATPFSEANGAGEAFLGVSFDFNFIDSRLPFITDFVLVNATTNETIRPIEDGEVLDLNTFDTRSFNIVALLDKPSKSVTFNSNGRRRFDLFAPFSVGGDFKGNFRDFTIEEGENTLNASSNSIVRGRGLVSGNPKAISFTVIPLEPLETVRNSSLFIPFLVTPNPVLRDASFKVAINSASNFQIKLNNLLNQPINTSKRVTIDKQGNGLLNLSGLISGYYFLTITDASNGKVFRSRILKR